MREDCREQVVHGKWRKAHAGFGEGRSETCRGDPVVSGNASRRFSHEFEGIWSLASHAGGSRVPGDVALDWKFIQKSADEARRRGKIVCRSRLGGMLNFYHQEAA
jgi:hypothetical protein